MKRKYVRKAKVVKPGLDIESDNREFFKLDSIDRKAIYWLIDGHPDGLRNWLIQLSQDYYVEKRIIISPETLYNEVITDGTLRLYKDIRSKRQIEALKKAGRKLKSKDRKSKSIRRRRRVIRVTNDTK